MSLDAMKQALAALEEINQLSIGENAICLPAEIDTTMDALRAAIEQTHGDWDEVETLRASLREHMAEIQRLRAAIEQAQPNARVHHKMMIAMIKEHWRSIDPQWKDDPELCHALGYEAGYNDAVAPKAEPRSGESGAGFESLPASPQWKGLTDEELNQIYAEPQTHAGQYARAIEAKLKEKNT